MLIRYGIVSFSYFFLLFSLPIENSDWSLQIYSRKQCRNVDAAFLFNLSISVTKMLSNFYGKCKNYTQTFDQRTFTTTMKQLVVALNRDLVRASIVIRCVVYVPSLFRILRFNWIKFHCRMILYQAIQILRHLYFVTHPFPLFFQIYAQIIII